MVIICTNSLSLSLWRDGGLCHAPHIDQGKRMNALLTDGQFLDTCREDGFQIFAAHARNLLLLLLLPLNVRFA